MATSRRNFLRSGSLVALAAGIPLASLERVLGADRTAPSIAGLTRKNFADHLNTNFVIHHAQSKVSVRLVEVENLRIATPYGEAFSLLFRGDYSTALTQNTYVIEHGKLGRFSFLLVPMGTRDKSAAFYEAIINRLHA